jgi:hypothetical protein
VFLLTVWTLVAAVTFVPAREDDNMVMTLLIIRFLCGGADRTKTHLHDQTNIQFRVLDTLEEQSSLKEEEEENPPHKRAVRAHIYTHKIWVAFARKRSRRYACGVNRTRMERLRVRVEVFSSLRMMSCDVVFFLYILSM